MLNTDDYYLFFTKEDIQTLKTESKITSGEFALYSNTKDGGILKFNFVVLVFEPSSKKVGTSIDIDFKSKIVFLFLSPSDFNEWLLHPNDWMRDNGPANRFGSANVYLRTENSKDFEFHKGSIENFLAQAQ